MKQTLKEKRLFDQTHCFVYDNLDFEEHYSNVIKRINAENKLTRGKVFRILQEEFGEVDK